MNWLFTFLCSVFFISLLFVNLTPSKDDKQVLSAVKTIVEKTIEKECVTVPCSCDSTPYQTATVNKNHDEMDSPRPTTNNNSGSQPQASTNDVPITHFLKDFGKYPKNRNHFYVIMNRI